jgi:SAM-dependent methyltransferase
MKFGEYTLIDRCLVCGTEDLEDYLFLGDQPLANDYKRLDGGNLYPLVVCLCKKCWHSQLKYQVNPSIMFDHYPYVSGTSKTLRDHFKELAEETVAKKGRCKVLDIASNDGTLLSYFKELGCVILGVDPAENIAGVANKGGIPTEIAYWNNETTTRVAEQYGEFDVVLAINVLPHVPDPQGFLLAIHKVLAPNGMVVIQTSQCDMFINGELDSVYSEHDSYFTVSSFKTLATSTGFGIVSGKKVPIHSMSFRWVLNEQSDQVSNEVIEMYKDEELKGLHSPNTYREFADKAVSTGHNLHTLISNYHNDGKIVIGFGASAKWNTLSNFAKIDLEWIVDDNPIKWGSTTPGRSTPIRSPDTIKGLDPSKVVVVLTAWNFKEEILENLRNLGLYGAKVITYFPEIREETV